MVSKIKAIILTILVFGGIIWYVMGQPGLDQLTEIKARWASKSELSEKPKSRRASAGIEVGKVIDQYNGVNIYYNGSVSNVKGRNVTKDGYNLGLRYQCVEFAKRYYYERFGHKMPDSYGHARDFYDPSVPYGQLNRKRNMIQYPNGGTAAPQSEDLVIIGPSTSNQYGHLFIVMENLGDKITFIQQNPGANNPSRGNYKLINKGGRWTIDAPNVVGWLRMQ